MAYVTIIRACFDGNHEECPRTENAPVQTPGTDIIVGGGICVCPCHHNGEETAFSRSIWTQAEKMYADKAPEGGEESDGRK